VTSTVVYFGGVLTTLMYLLHDSAGRAAQVLVLVLGVVAVGPLSVLVAEAVARAGTLAAQIVTVAVVASSAVALTGRVR
jgi:hypothetical protein